MNLLSSAVILFVLLAVHSFAQEVASMQILTEPSGAEFWVDGQRFTQPTMFLWPKGSKHVVRVANYGANCEAEFDNNCRVRYTFQGWDTNKGAVPGATDLTHVITADPEIKFLKATFEVRYRVNIAFYELSPGSSTTFCPVLGTALGPRPPGAGPGLIYLGGQCIPGATTLWLRGEYALQAVPFEGYVFRSWIFDNGTMSPTQYLSSVNVTGPMTIQPLFEPAKRVRLYTSPPELQLRIDRTVVNTADPRYEVPKYPKPGHFDWLANSTHLLSAVSPQTALDGNDYVFDSWSNGGAQDMSYNVGDDLNTVTELTAKFVRGVRASVLTAPDTLRVKVDDRDNFPYTFVWKVGSKVKLAAPAEQADSRGRRYRFKAWSNGGPAAQEISVDESHLEGGMRLTATYEIMPQAVIQTSLPGITVKVDGVDCAAPCKIDRTAGTTVRVTVPEMLPLSNVARQEFVGWHDGSPAERTVTFDKDTQTVLANYRKANRLTAILDPAEAAVVKTEPSSPDGFYPADSTVRVTVEPNPGFRFRRWDGDLSGTFRSGTVHMANSRIVRAFFDNVPFVKESGVRNAAGETPETGVAPGSLVSIFGANLASRSEASAQSRLSQTLAGAVVTIDDGVVPLVYVSPEQINAQLPSHLQPGNYTVRVRPEGMAEVKADFTVVRNAPGLFSYTQDSVVYAVAAHEDGSPVTPERPARRDETITLSGTGLGPYDRRAIDGFPVPASPAITVVDPVEVRIGETVLSPSWSGAAPGFSGVASTRVKLTDIPSGRHQVKIVVNGVESNIVVLPVE